MKKNVGDVDAYIRLMCGFTMLGMGITRKKNICIALGAMKIAEGIVRYCPLFHLMGISTMEHSKLFKK